MAKTKPLPEPTPEIEAIFRAMHHIDELIHFLNNCPTPLGGIVWLPTNELAALRRRCRAELRELGIPCSPEPEAKG